MRTFIQVCHFDLRDQQKQIWDLVQIGFFSPSVHSAVFLFPPYCWAKELFLQIEMEPTDGEPTYITHNSGEVVLCGWRHKWSEFLQPAAFPGDDSHFKT